MTMMKRLLVLLLLQTTTRFGLGDGDDGSISTNLEVLLPLAVKTSASMYHRDAMFGTVATLKDLVGEVEYVTPGDDVSGCSEDYTVAHKADDEVMPGGRIFLLDRGDCTFTHKVRIAQQKGASAVIIVDNKCYSANAAAWEAGYKRANKTQDFVCDETRIPFMAYDNSGLDVTIPAFLITKFDGQKLKECISMASSQNFEPILLNKGDCVPGDKVITKMVFDIPPSTEVSWQLWLTPDSVPTDMHLFHSLAKAVKSQAASSIFQPRYLVYRAADLGCEGKQGTGLCDTLCVFDSSEGICAFPSTVKDAKWSGSETVQEMIRQVCIWENRKNEDDWWDYMRLFANKGCSLAGLTCSDEIKITDSISKSVQDCRADTKNAIRKLADHARAMWSEKIITSCLVVNSVPTAFGLTPVGAARFICKGFASTEEQPSLCNCVPATNDEYALRKCIDAKCYDDPSKQFYCEYTKKCVGSPDLCISTDATEETNSNNNNNATPSSTNGSTSGLTLFFVIVSVAAVVGGIAFVFNKRARRQMQEEVRDILSEYMPLEELNSFYSNGGTRSGSYVRSANEENDTVGVI